jgi:hypothetical protein
MELKCRRWTLATRKDLPQMFHGLQQRINLPTGRRRLFPAEPRSHRSQTLPQSAPQPIDGFQGKRQPQFFRRRLERKSRQHFHQPPPEQRSGHRVTRQYVGQHEKKCPATTTTLPTVGTKYPLATERLAAGPQGIVADGTTVPVQCFHFSAAGAALLFERKSRVVNSRRSRTK